VSIKVTHKYPWKLEQIFTIGFFVILPVIIWFLTNSVATTIVVGVLGLALAITLVLVNVNRLKKSTLVATVDDSDLLIIQGNGYEPNVNRGKIKNIKEIRWDDYAYHPTLILNFHSGGVLKLPKRIALMEPLNKYLRDNVPANIFIQDTAKDVYEEIFGSGAVAPKVVRSKVREERIAKSVEVQYDREKEVAEVSNKGSYTSLDDDATTPTDVKADAPKVQRTQPKRKPKSKR